MIVCDKSDEDSCFFIQLEFRRVNDHVPGLSVVIFVADGFSNIMKQGGDLQPDTLRITHVMKALKLVKELTAQLAYLDRVLAFVSDRKTELDDVLKEIFKRRFLHNICLRIGKIRRGLGLKLNPIIFFVWFIEVV